MDCAAKFEKNVAALPGVSGAQLNIATRKLTVDGAANLELIRLEGKRKITLFTQRLNSKSKRNLRSIGSLYVQS